ncbi:hypothetical protein [Streptomyces sp. NBC_01589]|uniref:hypothetical protein n=1 Tax=unclassified Streptomyces TaxID=2593676 RepID=UPI003864FE46
MPTPYGAGPAAGDAASGAARPLLPRGVRGEVRPGGGGKGEGGDGEVLGVADAGVPAPNG